MIDKHILYVHGNDYRVHDNQAFSLLDSTVASFTPVAFLPTDHAKPNRYGMLDIGEKRVSAIRYSVADLANQYQRRNSGLYVLQCKQETALTQILALNTLTHCVRTRQSGFDERQMWERLAKQFPHVVFIEVDNHTLFDLETIEPFIQRPLGTFSQFRRRLEKQNLTQNITSKTSPTPDILPRPQRLNITYDEVNLQLLDALQTDKGQVSETLALRHVQNYFNSPLPHSYKQTRNALMGDTNFTRFSEFLALGCVSTKEIIRQLKACETRTLSSDGTEWILFELLWREYFFWMAYRHQKEMFAFTGVRHHRPLLSFYSQRFSSWCRGETQWPLVNACMQQLNQTGWMSNRGRQIVASCLVNELGVDWRYGAAYFQQQLIDYDVGSNWGNWQYIAGVGTDPRGGRRFNIEKQTEQYDSDGEFRDFWLQGKHDIHSDDTDYNGWPVIKEAE